MTRRLTKVVLSRLVSPLAIGIGAALVSLFLFERLADEVLEGDTRQFDEHVRDFIHSFASPAMTSVMRVLTEVGNINAVLVGTSAGCIALWLQNRRNGTVLLAINTGGGVLLMWSLKLLFHRQRPTPYFGLTKPSDYSFPSGHSLVAFCFYTALASIISAERPSLPTEIGVWLASGTMVTGIGVSRVYLGVHYPSDVLAGYLAAICWVSSVSLVYRRFRGRDMTQHLEPSGKA